MRDGVAGARGSGTETAARAQERTGRGWSSERVALWVFVLYLVAALPLLLWIGSYRWFFGDEWSFLADRSISVDELFRDHNQHWVTLPVLVYRGLYSLFGVRNYLPYQLLVVLLHLTLAGLLRIVMRRARVGPWTATIVAGTFVLLGAAEDNILWAFQIGFVAALVLGISQVVLADHEGAIGGRDWLGLCAGAAALMTTGQAIALVLAAGLVCAFRRRWRAAALHTVPLGILYLAWFLLSDVEPIVGIESEPFTLGVYLEWMWNAAAGLFAALGNQAPISLTLVLILVVGTAMAWIADGASVFVRERATPIALFVAAVVAMSLAGPGRFFLGENSARAGRYIGVMAALTLPLLAVAVDTIRRRWRYVGAAALGLLVVVLPLNAGEFGDDPYLTPAYFERQRNFVATLPELPIATAVPPWVQPNDAILGQPDTTIGWLLGARNEGKLPPPGQFDASAEQMATLNLGVAAVEGDRPETLTCAISTTPVGIDPDRGDRWLLRSPAEVAMRSGFVASSRWLPLAPGLVEITLPDLQLLVRAVPGTENFELCR
jgi:hypothetical protein